MGFIGSLFLVAIVWLLWNISRNTADALDKQTALQYEIVALEKRVDELATQLRSSACAPSEAPGDAAAAAGEAAAPAGRNRGARKKTED